MTFAAAIVLLLFQQETAETAFKKIEEALQKAETIKVVASCTAEFTSQGRTMKAVFDGTLLIKGSDKIKATLKVTQGEEAPQSAEVIANGGKMKGPGAAKAETPAKFRDEVVGIIPRLGSALAIQTVITVATGRAKERPPESSKWVLKGIEKGVGTLTFDVAYDGSTWNTTLEFEEKTHKLLKLTTQVTPKDPSAPGKAGTARKLVETLNVELGGEIADKEFETAEKK